MQSICLLYNIPGLDAVTVVDGFNTGDEDFNTVDDGFNTGDVDSDAVWNKIYKSTFFFLTLNLTL